jgi:putative tricarboxylic transport membrane protein
MLTRRHLLRTTAVAPVAAALPLSLLPLDAAQAQTPVIDLLKIFVPAAPGGGWDQTARTIEQVLRATGAVKGVQITNVGGAGGTVGLPQFLNQWKGQGNALMVGGMVMVGAIIANKSPVKLAQATPIARLTGEFEALVVPAQSPFKNAKDFAAALKADPSKVPVAGGSAGGTDHILLGMIAKALGVAPTKVSYVAYAGGGPATAALLGNQVAAGISGIGEFAEQIKAGKLRLIAISADKRQPGVDAPTLKEEGIDVELFNWRGVFAPPGVSDGQRKAMIELIERMAGSPQWAEACQKRDWTQITLTGDAYKAYIESETTRIEAILKELGLA